MDTQSKNQKSGAGQETEETTRQTTGESSPSVSSRDRVVDVAKAIGAVLAVPLTLFAISSSIFAQPFIALVLALGIAILASIWVVYTRWTGLLEVMMAWLVLIVVVLAGFVAWPRTVTVEGIVCDAAGAPVSGEKVVLIDVDGISREGLTDTEGHYEFRNVPSGIYIIRARGTEVGGGQGES